MEYPQSLEKLVNQKYHLFYGVNGNNFKIADSVYNVSFNDDDQYCTITENQNENLSFPLQDPISVKVEESEDQLFDGFILVDKNNNQILSFGSLFDINSSHFNLLFQCSIVSSDIFESNNNSTDNDIIVI
jgi:hypothetical protein